MSFRLLSSSLILLFSIVLFLISFRTNNFILDVLSSVTPYLLMITTLICILLFSWQFYHQELYKFSLINILGVLLLFLTFGISVQLISYWGYFPLPKVTQALSNQSTHQIAFLNKLYSNTNYSEIDNAVEQSQAEFLGFAELKTKDIPHINSLKHYPYSLIQPARDNSNIALFSKTPIVSNPNISIPYVLPLTTMIDQKNYYIFVVHFSPPINNNWLQDREDQMNRLATYINTLDHPENVIILGDFNTSIWSPSYKNFITEIPTLKNSSQNQGMLFTWHDHFLQTQIDHILVPNTASILDLKTLKVNGSDHNMVLTKLQFN